MEQSDNEFVKIVHSLVRPLVTLIFTATIALGWLQNRVSSEAFIGMAGMVIAFWFQLRGPTQTGEPPSQLPRQLGK